MGSLDFQLENVFVKMSEHIRKITLVCDRNWYHLINENGKEISTRMQFDKKIDAIEWAQAWISSWCNIELVVKDES